MPRDGLAFLLPLARDRRGVSALEFALVAGILATILLGVWDLGNAAQQQIRMQEALRAAAQYALSFPTDSTGIRNAVTAALPSGWTNVSVSTPTSSCSCWSASGGTTTSSTCSCPSGSTLQRFITLGVSRPFSPMLLSSITSVSARYAIRYQ
jgi:Flp pilus assembly protein TadG